MTYHFSIDKSPFEVTYGRPPPLLASYEKGTTRNLVIEQELLDWDKAIAKVKRQFKNVKKRMKKYHD